MRLPFEINFIEEKSDFGNLSYLYLIAKVKDYVIRKPIMLMSRHFPDTIQEHQRKLAEQGLLRWFWTHVFYYGEATKLERFMLFWKKRKKVTGAIIKQIFNKTYIIELL